VIIDPHQIGRTDPQIVTIQIRPADPPCSTFCLFCRIPLYATICMVIMDFQSVNFRGTLIAQIASTRFATRSVILPFVLFV